MVQSLYVLFLRKKINMIKLNILRYFTLRKNMRESLIELDELLC